MKATTRWIGRSDFGIKTWFTKREAVLDGAVSPNLVAFPFSKAWVDLYDGILLRSGARMPIHECWLREFGHCIGPRDRIAVRWPENLAEAWRASMDASIEERLKAVLNR